MELEKAAHLQASTVPEQNPIARTNSTFENGKVVMNVLCIICFYIIIITIIIIIFSLLAYLNFIFMVDFSCSGLTRRLSSASSLNSMEESFYLQASLDSSDTLSERRNPVDTAMSSYYLKSKTPNAFEAALRQKEGELASYMSRLVYVSHHILT